MNARFLLSGVGAVVALSMLTGLTHQPQKDNKQPTPAPTQPAKPADQPKPAPAQPTKPADQPAGQMTDEEKAWIAAATPGEHHAHLNALVGTWDAKVKITLPGMPPEESEGTMKTEWTLGGRFIRSDYSGSMMGQDFSGVSTWGYNNVSKQYEGTWIDTMGTGIMFNTGQCDATGKVFTMIGEYSDAMSGAKKKQKMVTTIVDDDTNTELFYDFADGKEIKMMEITYTRTAKPQKAKS